MKINKKYIRKVTDYQPHLLPRPRKKQCNTIKIPLITYSTGEDNMGGY